MTGELHLIEDDPCLDEFVDLGLRQLGALLAIYNEFETFLQERGDE